tara:strand:- start:45 stop:860 length:816 start_codon:yes stop_codon:yes gene_type:complete
MAVITTGKTFANGEQLSAAKLNQVISGATFNSSDAVDGSTMTIIGGAMAVDTIAAAQIGTDAVETVKIKDANVTKAKIENVADYKVLGNVSGDAAAPSEVAILDEDTMSSNSATSLATQQSIKAYVDANPGKIIQTKLASTTTEVSTTSVIPADDTAPLISEGAATGLSATMTPTSTSTTIRATVNGRFFNSTIALINVALFEDNTCVGVSSIQQSGIAPLGATYYFNSASTDAHTYTVRFGPNSGTATMDTTPTFGGLNKSTLFLEELLS